MQTGSWGGFYQHRFPRVQVNKIVYLLSVFLETYQIPQCSQGPAPAPGSPTATLNNSLSKAFNLLSSLAAQAPGTRAGWGGPDFCQAAESGRLQLGRGVLGKGIPSSVPQFPHLSVGGCVELRGIRQKSEKLWVLAGKHTWSSAQS